MPTYQVTAPNGKQIEITGDRMPTEAELHDIFAKAGVETGATPSVAGRAIGAAADAAPTVGGVVGGLVGGVPGAALGGAAGQGFKSLADNAGQIIPAVKDVARNLIDQPAATLKGAAQGAMEGIENAGKEAGLMAAGEGIGQGLVKGGTVIAKGLMHEAVSPTMSLAREFPDLSQTMIDNALTVSKGGLAKARALLSTAKATANGALDAADAAGARVPLTAATSGLQKTFNEIAVNSSDPAGALNRLAAIERKIGIGRPTDLSMREADALKTGLQNEARALYKSIQAGNGSRNAAIEMVAKADMAQALNQAIEDIASNAGAPGYKAANSAAQDLIGATRAISRRLLQNGGPTGKAVTDLATPSVTGAVLGGGAGAAAMAAGTVAGKMATTPSNLSRAALYLSNPAVQAFIRQLPKPAVEALGHLFGDATSDSNK